MTKNLKIHMIGNAHLDPVWLWYWHWQRSSDEALACDQKISKNDLQSIIDQYFSPPHFWDDYRDGQRLQAMKE